MVKKCDRIKKHARRKMQDWDRKHGHRNSFLPAGRKRQELDEVEVVESYLQSYDSSRLCSISCSNTTKVMAAFGATRKALGKHPLKKPETPSRCHIERAVLHNVR